MTNARNHAALTLNPQYGAALWLNKRLVARIAGDIASSIITPDDPEPRWHKDAMVFVNAVNDISEAEARLREVQQMLMDWCKAYENSSDETAARLAKRDLARLTALAARGEITEEER